jgi:HEPN domain-containing protein
MTGKRLAPDDPTQWLNRARSNLIQAQTRVAGVYLEDLCFAAQQAAEKAIKALLMDLDIDFPYTHDITRLLSLVEQNGQYVSDRIKAAGALSDYAVESRYPGLAEPITEDEYSEALSVAEQLVGWAETIIRRARNENEARGKPSPDSY